MKKLIMMIMALCLIAPVANADLSKKEQKAVESLAKKKLKEMKKDGWKIMGVEPLETALQRHLSQTEFSNKTCRSRTVSATAKTKNNARQMCLNQALSEYVKEMMTQIKQMTASDAFVDQANIGVEEFDRFHSACESKSQGEIRGELQESFTVYRELADGRYEFEMNFIINEERAAAARQRAIFNAAKESGLAQEYANQIHEYLNKNMPD